MEIKPTSEKAFVLILNASTTAEVQINYAARYSRLLSLHEIKSLVMIH
jgi:hypothetical protein